MKKGTFLVHNSETALVDASLKYLNTFLLVYRDQEGKEVKVPKDIENFLGNMALFSVVWGVGGALEEKSRKLFNDVMQRLIT